MRGQIESNTTAIWRQTAAVVAQFDGLVVGYNAVAAAGEALTPMHFLEASWDVCFVALMPAGLVLFALFCAAYRDTNICPRGCVHPGELHR